MPARIVFVACALLAAACSGSAGQSGAGGQGGHQGPTGAAGAAGRAADAGVDAAGNSAGQGAGDALIFPPGLDVQLEQGGAGLFDLTALTLRDGPDGLELYAALKNTGDIPACDAALKVWINDKNNQPLGMFINGLDTRHLYLYPLDGGSTVAACASPGDVAMTNIFTMAPDITVADVGSVVYYYVYFVLDGISLIQPGLTVDNVQSVTGPGGTSYTGTITNGLDIPVTQPSVRIFPVNGVGRPLGVAGAGDSSQIPPGGTWTFQTNSVDMPGVDYAAYPGASFSN